MYEYRPQPKPVRKKTKRNKKDRSEFPEEVRQRIVEKYNGRCGHCYKTGEHIHHVRPKGSGGRGVYTNGLLLCAGCHTRIHMDSKLMRFYKDMFERLHGPDYYKDKGDLNNHA